MEKSMAENRAVRNLIHASANKEEFEYEFEVWRKFIEN